MEGHDRPTKLRERPPRRLLELTSPAFGPGERIPFEHTKDGMNRSPELRWGEAPEGTRSFALLCEDPDAPTRDPFVHWVIFDIPAGAMGLPLTGIPEGIAKDGKPHDVPGATQGTNDFGRIGYDGPFPPRGHGVHHYRFMLFALDGMLDLHAGARRDDVFRAMTDRVLARGELVGLYSR